MRQGGLCTALEEVSCFYDNQSGIIRESVIMVRNDLHEREGKEKIITDTKLCFPGLLMAMADNESVCF